MATTATTRLLAWLLGTPSSSVQVDASGVRWESKKAKRAISHQQAQGVEVTAGRLWSDIKIPLRPSDSIVCRGLKPTDAAHIAHAIKLWALKDQAAQFVAAFNHPQGQRQYLTHSLYTRWKSRLDGYPDLTQVSLDVPGVPDEVLASFKRLRGIVAEGEQARAERNRAYVQEQSTRHAELFKIGQGYPLNDEQIAAILHDEDRSLVVAGAGTGKTSTIVGKVIYLVKEGLAKPSELLLLAFTRKEAEEMESRLKQLTGSVFSVKTFHSLGLQAIAEATGKKPSLSKLAEDSQALRKALQDSVVAMFNDRTQQAIATEFLGYFKYPYQEPESFRTAHEYHQHIRGHDVRSLNGERLKSVEESLIANWLILHGIAYEYERPYEHDTASIQFRQYKPDFYLLESGIYIEHFGINSQGKPPPFITDPKRYLDGIAWKRAEHQLRGTKLVETFSHQASAGTLLRELEKALRSHGVKILPPDPARVKEILTRDEVLNPFITLVTSFLNLFKGNAWTREEVRARVDASKDIRATKFLAVFDAIAQQYEKALQSEGAIDFSDMINAAVDHVKAGRFAPGYKYILVDEFQDISRGRARLIQGLLDQVPGSKLFCVGDDWQSIYRFTGSDIDLMTRFADHFGFTRRTDLRKTHRFNDRLLMASSNFVMANPQQLKKDLIAAQQSDLPAIQVVSVASETEKVHCVRQVLETIAAECCSDKFDVLLVGRYNFLLDECKGIKPPDPRMTIRSLTVHSAKGMEADYVVVLDVVNGRYGFPTEITDDPLLDLVLAGRTPFPHAEERRLFYVALTRARTKTFLLTRDVERSVFVDEIESKPYAALVIPSGAAERTVACPKCTGGRLVAREGEWGRFWGCSNFPQCVVTAKACPWCGVGAFVPGQVHYRCANPDCGRSADVCPRCGVGAVVPREGRYGGFSGCSEWRSNGPSCTFKMR